MGRKCRIVICSFLPLIFSGTIRELLAQSVQVQGGNQSLSITTGFAGSEPIAVVNASSSLSFSKSGAVQKITVQTTCLGQSFTLKVLATNQSFGTPAPEVTLTNGMPATDFLNNIPKRPPGPNNGTCDLRYTASATFAQGNSAEEGNDVHTVTYTILAQ